VNAPIRVNPEVYRIGDLQFIAQLKTASRAQLYAMQAVFARLGSEFDWKRAAVEARIAKTEGLAAPFAFGWVKQERWWEEEL
jgi:hypothetical protein